MANISSIDSDIAIIGMSCRLPGAEDTDIFWDNLRNSVHSVFEVDSVAAGQQPDGQVSATGRLLGIELFDADFFQYSRREAELIDPQQRVFLECVWEALESAGYAPQSHAGRVGIFAGCGINTYLINNVHPNRAYRADRSFLESIEDLQVMIANEKDFIASRAAYKFDFRGPAINVQAACATSLICVHLACQSLLLGECRIALAGSSTIRVPQSAGHRYEEGMVFSPDGYTRAFDAKAGGTTFGSGVAAIALKRLRDAIDDGDAIHAIIRGTATNNDGSSKVGFTAPGVHGQAEVIREALDVAGIESDSISYVEAHGTGTPIGDPIEIAALTAAFDSSKRQFCAVGTVKSNLGHLSWSSGMAGLIKTVLALKHREIPPTLHFKTANPQIDFSNTPFFVNSQLTSWPEGETPRRAGVSAFGLGGSNAHVILQEWIDPKERPRLPRRSNEVLTISAKSEVGLLEYVQKYNRYLERHSGYSIEDVCYTANVGRPHFSERAAFVCTSIESLKAQLAAYVSGHSERVPVLSPGAQKRRAHRKVVFMFTGQGAQYSGMGKVLYETSPIFRDVLDSCESFLMPTLKISLLDILFQNDNSTNLLDQMSYAQVALFAFEYALAQLWMSLGVNPDFVIGHSAGEYVAACIAGVFSLEDGLKLSAARGRLFEQLVSPNGQMATLSAQECVVLDLISPFSDYVSIAALNGPLGTVISGRVQEIEIVCDLAVKEGITVKKLPIARAGHSPMTEGMLIEFRKILDGITFNKPSISLVSNVTGAIVSDEIQTAEYWCRHTRQSVRFAEGMESLARGGANTFVEIGPDPILLGMGIYCLHHHDAMWLPSIRRTFGVVGRDEWQQFLESVAKLYVDGHAIDWKKIYLPDFYHRIHQPTYPFQRKKYWIESGSPSGPMATHDIAHVSELPYNTALLTPTWVKADLSDNLRNDRTPSITSAARERWIILADTLGVGDALAARLVGVGGHCELIYQDERSRLAKTLMERSPITGIVCLWTSDPIQPECQDTSEGLVSAVWEACSVILEIVKALQNAGAEAANIWLVTRSAQPVVISDRIEGILQAPAWAVARVIGMEHPSFRCIRVDLGGADDLEQGTEMLFREIHYGSSEDTLAFRGATRYVSRLSKAKELDLEPSSSTNFLSWKTMSMSEGTTLVTGGLGGVGLLVAEWLSVQGAKNLVLLGRQPPGQKETSTIEKMRQRGTSIIVWQGDVTNMFEMEALFDHIDAEELPLLGIVHAAGVLDDALALQQEIGRFKKVLSPKVQGSWNLHLLSIARAPKLQFFALFSSAASLLGNPGQANHAAANAFLDALAHYRESRGFPCTAINWGAWSETGAILRKEAVQGRLVRLGFQPISSHEGLSYFEYVLTKSFTQIGVIPMNWANFISECNLGAVPFFSPIMDVGGQSTRKIESFIDRLSELNQSEWLDAIKKISLSAASHVLGLPMDAEGASALNAARLLSEYGLDSLSSLELRNRIQGKLGFPIPSTLIVENPTILQISEYIHAMVLSRSEPTYQSDMLNLAQRNKSFTHRDDFKRKLSMQQKRWLSLVEKGYGQRIVPIVFYAQLDHEKLREALLLVIQRHELLRFYYPNDTVAVAEVANVLPDDDELFVDISQMAPADRTKALSCLADRCRTNMPDPAKRPSWNVHCVRFDDSRFLLIVSLQHLDFDGTSLTTFVEEIRDVYHGLLTGKSAAIAEAVQYSEYVDYQRAYMEGPIREDRSFFQGLFASLPRTTALSGHHGFGETRAFESGRHSIGPFNDLWLAVQAKALVFGVTVFAVLLAAYARLISDITDSKDLVISVIVNGRSEQRFAKCIGPFTAPFPVKISIDGASSHQLVLQCHRMVSAINARSSYPVSDLSNHVYPFKGFPIDSYFSDIGINFTNYRHEESDVPMKAKILEILGPIADREFEGANIRELGRIPGLHLVIDMINGELRFNFWYHLHRFKAEQICHWAERYLVMLLEIVETPNVSSPIVLV